MKKKQEFHLKHSLGQNFLTDESLLASLVALSGVSQEDSVLEIGPGAGSMTKELAKVCKQVTAVEIDETLLPILNVTLGAYPNVTVVHGDAMKINLGELMRPNGDFHIVANLPYYITTPLLTMLLGSNLPILSMNIMLQKEAAEKICAKPGEDGYCPLAIRAQWAYEPEIAAIVPARMFTPPPKVDSAFLTMKKRPAPLYQANDEKHLFKLVNAAFAMRRKTLVNNISNAFSLSKAESTALITSVGLPETVRGESLSIEEFVRLSNRMCE